MLKLFISVCLVFLSPPFSVHTVHCEIKTSAGDFSVELFPHQAPKTCANFLRYVDARLYDGTDFFRVQNLANQDNRPVKIEVIQGGDLDSAKKFPALHFESTKMTGLSHRDGTISMARGDTGTAQSSFFICINDQPELDFGGKRNPDGQGFSAFGKVTEGMDVVRKIYNQPFEGQFFVPKILIHSIRRKS